MTYRLEAWNRFLDPAFWWMHAMVLVWAIFTVVLFARWFRERAARDPDGTFRLVRRQHVILLTLSLLTVAAAVIGAHGGL